MYIRFLLRVVHKIVEYCRRYPRLKILLQKVDYSQRIVVSILDGRQQYIPLLNMKISPLLMYTSPSVDPLFSQYGVTCQRLLLTLQMLY